MTKNTIAGLLVAVLLAAGSARAAEGDADFEERFHEAYVTEVIEGRVADAARVYLDLMAADAAPALIRAEAKFRFAVCAALLGRADEAAAHLGALIAAPGTPEELRARARAYLDTVEGIGVGSELTRKLDALVFELGRASPSGPDPEVYRDFEVIGTSAIPFLRKLLGHPDAKLRQHAFRLLARLGADGVAAAWTPSIGLDGTLTRELGRWLDSHPEERRDLEERLLEASDETLVAGAGGLGQLAPHSEGFLRALAGRDTQDLAAYLAAQNASRTDSGWPVPLLVEWVRERPDVLGDRATTELLMLIGRQQIGVPAIEGAFAAVVCRPSLRSGRLHDDVTRGIERWAREMPAAAVVAEMARLLEPANGGDVPHFLLAVLANALDHRLDEVDLGEYAALIEHWLDAVPHLYLLPHLPPLFAALPEGEGVALARFVFERVNDPRWAPALPPVTDGKSAAALEAAWRAAPAGLRGDLTGRLHLFGNRPPPGTPPEIARIQIETLESLLGAGDITWLRRPLGVVGQVLALLPEDEAAERLVSLVRTAIEAYPREKGALTSIDNSLPLGVFVRAAPALVDAFGPDHGGNVVGRAMVLLKNDRGGLEPAIRRALADFVLDHLEALPDTWWNEIAANPETYPPGQVVAEAPSRFVPQLRLEPARAAEAARALTEDPARVTTATLVFVQQKVPDDVAAEIAGRLFAATAGERRIEVHHYLKWHLPLDGIQAALDAELAAEAPDPALVRKLAEDLATRRPSEALFPAVRFLLGVEGTEFVIVGIDLAQKLGREELLPALAEKLDSMDPAVREKAKAAMDSILELKRLKSDYRK